MRPTGRSTVLHHSSAPHWIEEARWLEIAVHPHHHKALEQRKFMGIWRVSGSTQLLILARGCTTSSGVYSSQKCFGGLLFTKRDLALKDFYNSLNPRGLSK
eukprot:1138406-Pelagomonas_calceolata.AAC.2